MTEQEKKEKNKKGIANIILIIGIMLIIFGVTFGFKNLQENAVTAFFMCGAGTILTFVSNYMKNGYIKFFN